MPEGRVGHLALATDLYELTMGGTCLALGMNAPATFSLFVRTLPPVRSYLVAAGLEQALDRLGALAFDADDADYLRASGRFSEEQLEKLLGTRFSGDVWAVPEPPAPPLQWSREPDDPDIFAVAGA